MFACWPSVNHHMEHAGQFERRSWGRLWSPLTPALLVVAWLCGWALSEPDPVPDRLGWVVLVAWVPFGFVAARAIVRAAWSLLRRPEEYGLATIGLIRPRIVLSADLARLLDERSMQAALEHERAHARHRDPLRIWAGQFVADLQWPWPWAQKRFRAWLAALECARDDEARAAGVDGPDLAAAVLTSLRFHSGAAFAPRAELTGEASALKARIARLLQPLPEPEQGGGPRFKRVAFLLTLGLMSAVTLGVVFGERLIEPLLALTS